MTPDDHTLSHVGPDGAARMVDVGEKAETMRVARACGSIRMAATTLAAITANSLKKGDVIAVARVAGIMAAKKTAELIPLCHPVVLSDVQVDITPAPELPGLKVEVTARSFGRTGVEIEAISAVCVTLVTVFDMVKAVDKGLILSDIRVLEKSGGRSGSWKTG